MFETNPNLSIRRYGQGILDLLDYDDGIRVIKVGATSQPLPFDGKVKAIEDFLKAAELSPDYKLTLKEVAKTAGDIWGNFLGVGFSNGKVSRYNECNFDLVRERAQQTGESQPVVLFFHGYYQSRGAAWQFVKDAEKRGLSAISIGYNFWTPATVFTEDILLPTLEEVTAYGGEIKGIVGHSTGANNCRLGILESEEVRQYLITDRTKVILSAPTTSGTIVPTLMQRLALPFFPKVDDVRTEEGQDIFIRMNRPIPEGIEAYTFLCEGDMLVTPRTGIDTNNRAVNVIVPNGGHFAGSGVSKIINGFYLDLIANGVPRT
ncbi:hypothetical protein COY27_05395 [Candidatus Woesearchaeota archaeon CG_4_10_14_0_2_um_filter_33_13]|nr:MAG: hypothetical protein COY27_05395 [Candidatus Woesearchaeota archaeon CG_4_10_14_0_2_um_filter_33_13]